MLSHGTLPDGAKGYDRYQIGNRNFSGWESFERSCADLDAELCESSTRCNDILPAVRSGLLFRVWVSMIIGAQLQPAESTPFHMQAPRSPEVLHTLELMQDIFDIHQNQSGKSFKTSRVLYTNILRTYLQRVRARFMDSEMHEYLTYSERQEVSEHAAHLCTYPMPMTPVAFESIKRTINRTVRFLAVRRCTDKPECGTLHYHGLRPYYNPSRLNELTGKYLAVVEPDTGNVQVVEGAAAYAHELGEVFRQRPRNSPAARPRER
jgi:hypothetical protein